MTFYELIQNANEDELAKIIFKLDVGLYSVAKRYACNFSSCFNDKCVDCYKEWLRSEVKQNF